MEIDENPETPGEFRLPELPKNSEWRSWYRSKAWAWLRENKGYWFANVDNCLGNLEENPGCCEAAVALFWSVYLADEMPMQLTEKQVGQIKAMLDRAHGEGEDKLECPPFVKLHLAGTLAVSLIRPGVDLRECPTAVTALEVAGNLGDPSFLKGIDKAQCKRYGQYWGRMQLDSDLFRLSAVLVYGILALEFALWQAKEEKYEKALSAIDVALYYLHPSQFHSSDAHYDVETGKQYTLMPSVDRTFTYLPHSWDRFDPQDAANLFEEMRTHADMVRDWEAVRQACKGIGQADLVWNDVLIDRDGEECEGHTYWKQAETFAECQLGTQKSEAQAGVDDLMSRITHGETSRLEFKSSLRWNVKANRDDPDMELAVLKTIAAFCNTEGGELLIGVADDKSILGIENDHYPNDDKFLVQLGNLIAAKLVPSVVQYVNYGIVTLSGKSVCHVVCKRSSEGVWLKVDKNTNEVFYVRSGPSSMQLAPREAFRYIREHFGK